MGRRKDGGEGATALALQGLKAAPSRLLAPTRHLL